MGEYKLTHNGADVGVYGNGILALEAVDDVMKEIGGKYNPKVNHTAVDCDTGEEITTIIYQTGDGTQQVFLIEKAGHAE